MEYDKNNRVVVEMPFSGFYETLHSDWLDSREGCEVMDIIEDNPGLTEMEVGEEYNRVLSEEELNGVRYIQALQIAYCKDYIKAINSLFGNDLDLKFESLTSPRFYNFETDRLFVTVEKEKILELMEKIKSDKNLNSAFNKEVKEKFTSREGFVSFYDNYVEKWGDIENWDHNQLGVILSTTISNNPEEIDINNGYDLVSFVSEENFDNTREVFESATDISRKKFSKSITNRNKI